MNLNRTFTIRDYVEKKKGGEEEEEEDKKNMRKNDTKYRYKEDKNKNKNRNNNRNRNKKTCADKGDLICESSLIKTVHDLSEALCDEHDDDDDDDDDDDGEGVEEEEDEEEMSELTEALLLLFQTDEGDSIADLLADIKLSLRSITSDIKVMAGHATTSTQTS